MNKGKFIALFMLGEKKGKISNHSLSFHLKKLEKEKKIKLK